MYRMCIYTGVVGGSAWIEGYLYLHILYNLGKLNPMGIYSVKILLRDSVLVW